MATYRATTGNDRWTVPEFGDPSGTLIDGLAGTDILSFDRLSSSRFIIKQDAATGYILVDSVSGASSTFHLKLVNVERLSFSNGSNVVDLTTMFGDSTPPRLSTATPAAGSSGLAVASNLVLTFNETIARGAGNINLLDSNGVVVESFAAGSTRLTLSGNTLTIDPTAALGSSKTYTLNIDAGAIKDTSGNSYAGLNGHSFSTVENTAPVAATASFTLQEDNVLSGSVPVATDAQGQSVSYLLVQNAAHGSVVVNTNGTFSYTPAANYAGADSFLYSASDGELNSAATTISLAIQNVVDRFTGTSGADQLTGTGAADQLQGLGGDDALDGGAGLDTALFAGARSGYQLTKTATGWTVANAGGTEGSDTLTNIERLQFSDSGVALDFDGNAAKVAKLIGAVFGKAALANPTYVGIGLKLLDQGVSDGQLANMALGAALGATPDSGQIVDVIYRNIFDTSAPAALKATYVGLLDNGTLTPATLVQVASDTSFNTTHIDLVGLAQTGIAYTPA